MKRTLQILCALLTVVFTVLCVRPYTVKASASPVSSVLADYGFDIDTSDYTHCTQLGKTTETVYDDRTGCAMLEMTTRVWVLRANNSSYDDVVLVWTELEPLQFSKKNFVGLIKIYKGYPESLKTILYPPEYCTSSPKSLPVPVSQSLVIMNQSSSSSDRSEIFYDYRPGLFRDNEFDYIGSTTEQIGMTYIHSDNENYSFFLGNTVNCGYTSGVFIHNGNNCTSRTQSRTIKTEFQL